MLVEAILVHGVIGYKFCWLLPSEDRNQGTPVDWAPINRTCTSWARIKWRRCRGPLRGHESAETPIGNVSLPSPTNVKGVKQFLSHVGFYRRFIKDFSKLSRPLCELLMKDAKFIWDDRCQRSFEELKIFLTTAPIVRAPNWQLPFKVMCDASDFAIGVVLEQREYGKPYVIYYASKTLNEAQRNYTTTEKRIVSCSFCLG